MSSTKSATQKIARIVFTLAATAALAGCPKAPNREGNAVLQINDNGKALGGYTIQLSKEDLSAGVMGIDANKNGIRDDIDRLIAEKYSSTPQIKKAAEGFARADQLFVLATTKEEAYQRAVASDLAMDCISQIFFSSNNEEKFYEMIDSLHSMTLNTKERYLKSWDSNHLIGGQVFPSKTNPNCN